MISLLLILSIFVSSGVLWELRDTVITMVNEPLCGIEEHEHTDECYEYRLVCGLEENEEHTHTDECYEKVLVCGHDEHFHTALCYTDEELTENSVQSEDDKDIISIELPADDENENVELPVFKLGNDSVRVMDGEGSAVQDDEYNPVPIETIDNIAKGITFTLFDYHDPENALEARQNNYGISWDSEHNQWVHNNIKYVGVNYDFEKNKNRNIYNDILFFAYGTPAFTGEVGTFNVEGNNAYKNYQRDWDTVNDKYNPSKNNYAGDYNKDASGNTLSGNRPVQGIVVNQLVDGYPKINNVVDGTNYGSSLAYLFNDTPSDYKTVYKNVNHLLKDKDGHLVYNSDKNYAYFDKDTNNFIIYNGTYHIINDNHHRAGDHNNRTEETYEQANGYEMQIGFFPFDQYNTERRDPNFDGGNDFNHHFGLKMEADFINVPNPSEAVIFKYSGDDDMWVFVDGKLLLDIGGIHEPAEGLIDFTNGYVWVQDDIYGQSYSEIMGTTGMNTGLKQSEMPDNFDEDNDHKWIVKSIGELIGSDWDNTTNHKHSIKMFYLERGGCYSNLAMDMNLPTVRPLSVTKSVDYNGHYSDDYDSKDYSFTIYEKVNNEIVPANFGDGTSNTFTLKAGQRKDFYDLAETREFYVVETGIDTNIFSGVNVNGVSKGAFITPIGNTNIVSGDAVPLSSINQYDFTNVVREEQTTINVNKSWIETGGSSGNNDSKHDTHSIYFKLYRADSLDSGAPKQIEINGVSTFTLNKGNNWTMSFSDLPSRYGEHIYTYSVKELNVPDGYEVSYVSNGSGGLTIKNTANSDAELWVRKQWIDAPLDQQKPVELTLKRKRVSSSSTPASLTINLLDPGGNPLNSVTTSGVYEGGSVEFSLDVPGTVNYWWRDSAYEVDGQQRYYKLSSESLGFRKLGDKRFEVSNLQQGSNTIDIKIIADNTDDSLLLLHHSFTRNTNGWEANGETPPEGYNYDDVKNNGGKFYAEILTSGGSAYAKGDGLLVRGRTADWHGVKLKLDPLKFKANHTYTFSVYVKYDNEASFPSNAGFVMTFNDGRESSTSYKRVAVKNVQKGTWTQLTGTVTLPDDINPYGMFLLIETNDSDGNENTFNGPEKFRMDEFTAVEGYKDVSVTANTGEVTISNHNDVIYNFDFSDGKQGWVANKSYGTVTPELNVGYDDGNNGAYTPYHFLEVTHRKETVNGSVVGLEGNGAKRLVPDLIPGVTYRFEGQMQGNGDNEAQRGLLSIDTINTDPNGGQYSNTKNITPDPLVLIDKTDPENINGYNWAPFDCNFTIPSYADRYNMFLYFETPYNSKDYGSFRIKPFTITPVQPELTADKAGYTLTNPGVDGVYKSNNDQYQIAVDMASITSPRFYSDSYELDTGFSMTIPISSADNWEQHYTKAALGEETGYRYLYYVVSENVIGATVDQDYVMLPIENNNVASNDESSPILVKNKNIKFKLPETGGGGKDRIYFFGGVLTAIGIISLSALYRRKRRRV